MGILYPERWSLYWYGILIVSIPSPLYQPNLSALTAEAEKWEMKNNPIVAVAVEMARQLAAMAEIAQFGDEDAKKEVGAKLCMAFV